MNFTPNEITLMRNYKEAQELIERQAANLEQALATIEQMREVLEDVRGNINPERGFADELELDVARVVCLQPCPDASTDAVLNKVRADAVREAADLQWRNAMDECKKNMINPSMRNDLFFGIAALREYADRIEKGEA